MPQLSGNGREDMARHGDATGNEQETAGMGWQPCMNGVSPDFEGAQFKGRCESLKMEGSC
jgi:hypothetical protein